MHSARSLIQTVSLIVMTSLHLRIGSVYNCTMYSVHTCTNMILRIYIYRYIYIYIYIDVIIENTLYQ